MIDQPRTLRVAALLACHNRRELTVASIASLNEQPLDGAQIDVVLLDAASPDGTADAVESRFDNVTVLRGHADLFWARGMHAAFRHAVDHGPYDFYLWLNDDTILDSGAIHRLFATHEQLSRDHSEPTIVVGATRDPDTGEVTYGGIRRSAVGSPLRFESSPPDADRPLAVDTMNGNCVLIPQAVVERIGIIDPQYFHSLADFDYGLRAQEAGCRVWVAPGTIGTCKANTLPASRARRLRSVFDGPQRLRLREWYTFARRWGGRWWPALVPAPYVSHARAALSRQDSP